MKPISIIITVAGAVLTGLFTVVGWFLVQMASDVRDMNSRVWALSQAVAVLAATMPKNCDTKKDR